MNTNQSITFFDTQFQKVAGNDFALNPFEKTALPFMRGRDELRQHFKGWTLLLDTHDSFDAPQNTRKEFSTIVARKSKDK